MSAKYLGQQLIEVIRWKSLSSDEKKRLRDWLSLAK